MSAMKTLRRIVRGCGRLPHCGDHPGNEFLFMFAAMGCVAGSALGVLGVLGGMGIMLCVFGPMHLVGAHSRAVIEEYYDKKEAAK